MRDPLMPLNSVGNREGFDHLALKSLRDFLTTARKNAPDLIMLMSAKDCEYEGINVDLFFQNEEYFTVVADYCYSLSMSLCFIGVLGFERIGDDDVLITVLAAKSDKNIYGHSEGVYVFHMRREHDHMYSMVDLWRNDRLKPGLSLRHLDRMLRQ